MNKLNNNTMTVFLSSDAAIMSSSVDYTSDIIETTQTHVHIAMSKMEYTYAVLTAVTSGCSMIGGVFIGALYYLYKDMRTSGRKVLLFLAISDSFVALGNLLGVVWFLYRDSSIINKSMGYCIFQSAMTIYFSNVSFSWTVIMGVCLLASTVLNNAMFTAKYMNLFHVLSWLFPGIITTLALCMGVLGYDQTLDQASWCWIDPRVPNALLWQFVTGKFWEILAYITTVVLYTTVKVFLYKQSKRSKSIRTRNTRTLVIQEANRKLTFVPLVFILLRIWGTLRFLLGSFAHEYASSSGAAWIVPLQIRAKTMQYLTLEMNRFTPDPAHIEIKKLTSILKDTMKNKTIIQHKHVGVGDSAQGFANFVIYCFSTEKIRNRLLRSICRIKRSEVEPDTGGVPARSTNKSEHRSAIVHETLESRA